MHHSPIKKKKGNISQIQAETPLYSWAVVQDGVIFLSFGLRRTERKEYLPAGRCKRRVMVILQLSLGPILCPSPPCYQLCALGGWYPWVLSPGSALGIWVGSNHRAGVGGGTRKRWEGSGREAGAFLPSAPALPGHSVAVAALPYWRPRSGRYCLEWPPEVLFCLSYLDPQSSCDFLPVSYFESFQIYWKV